MMDYRDEPTSERRQQSLHVPPWAIPVVMTVIGALGGYTGHDVMVTEQPAVLAQGISSLQADVSELRTEIRELRDAAAQNTWTRQSLATELGTLKDVDRATRDELEALQLRVRILETQ